MRYGTKIITEEVQRIDPETGELQTFTKSKTFVKKVDEKENFYFQYCYFLKCLYDIPGEAFKLLVWFMSNMNPNTNEISMSKKYRERCIQELNISVASYFSFFKTLREFTFPNEKGEPEYLLEYEGGVVTVNPLIAWKGKKDTRNSKISEMKFKVELI